MSNNRDKTRDNSSRKWLIALAIVALLIVGFWLWWRAPNSSIKSQAQQLKPELQIASLNITDIDKDKISATSNVVLRNNLPMEVKTNRLDYVIYIDSAKVIEDSYSKPITIRSSDTTAIKLPMEIMFRKIGAVMKKFENKNVDSADYSMKATFQVEVPIAGQRNFTMNFSKRLPALKPLKAKMGDIDVGKLGFKESSIDITLNVENPNAFPMKMKDGKYKFSLDNDQNIMEGVMQKVVDIPAHASAPVAMHVDMKTMKIPKLGWKMLFDKKDTHFRLNFSSKLIAENGMLNNSRMDFNMEGTLDELTKAVAKK
jgi:LEA14-like dessication related protein